MKTVSHLREDFIEGKTTPTKVVAESLSLIRNKNKDINAFLFEYEEEAVNLAKQADDIYKKGGYEKLPLLGVPIAIKNNILIKGKIVTAASRMLKNYQSVYDATIVKRLKEAGAIIVGATNLDEFAMGSSTENSAFGTTKNPLDKSRVPGGSSGGSAAAVAMGSVPVAIGTDTGGSIRQPASFCGLVGFKPTYGAVSRYGLIAMGSSLDQAGPLANTVADAGLLHKIISGKDSNDATTFEEGTYPKTERKSKYTFGVPEHLLKSGVDESVSKLFYKHLEFLKDNGHELKEVKIPLFEQGLSAYYIVMPAEVSSNLARYDGIRYGLSVEDSDDLLSVYKKSRSQGFGTEVKRRVLLGTYVLSSGYYDAYYGKAQIVRNQMRSQLSKVLQEVDFVVTPTTPTSAFKLGEKADPLSMYKQDIFTVPANLTGAPALTFPMGEVSTEAKDMPVGVQYLGRWGNDFDLLSLGEDIYDKSMIALE